MEYIIQTTNIQKSFPLGSKEMLKVLKGIDLNIEKGKLTILRGRSGSGKTTLLNILSILDELTEGQLFINGVNMADKNEAQKELIRRYDMGFVFQSVALVPIMSAYENVDFGLRLADYKGDRDARIKEVLSFVGLKKRMNHPVSDIGEMRTSIQTAKSAWQNRILLTSREYLEYEKMNICLEGREDFWEEKDWTAFSSALESCNQEAIRELLNAMEVKVNQESMLCLSGFFAHIRRIVLQVENLMAENEMMVGSKRIEQIMEEFRCGDTISDIFMHLNLYICKSIQSYYDRKNAMKKQPIIKAEEYINKHYMEDISQEEMAELVGLSSTYFSKLFKSVEGVNYIEYLTQIRLDRSKKLLITTNMSIKSIASAVGYMDEKYFRKLFKKVVGIKPTEYRKLH